MGEDIICFLDALEESIAIGIADCTSFLIWVVL
jgi:hypothetical protein